ncbi:helix-turn-helix domain-containing protein [Streptomyces roseoverticillatus]|uniref:helix-turn-helix domain-containing protein n=1 Tax=Streptomyces roseoverticillatus TaxID=66429 RepID=UPI001F41129C|nr:helix-turn-helix transcriptional regulator [Streptomyces roseoverticillatus]MCF3103442.1 helix-turn-helix domain-containing protein [Streptomyces roseoverticillatus]
MGSQPPMTWRLCGNQAKLWRTRAGVTREELAREANYDFETVKSMEQGRRRPTERFLQVTDDMCGAHGFLIAMLDYLGPEKSVPGYDDLFRYEEEAISICSYQPLLIPGLLQTEEAMRALFNAHWPPLEDDVIDQRVSKRLTRQKLLEKRSRAFVFVIGEAALRNTMSGVEGHKRQLARLLEAAAQRNVILQVMVTEGGHPEISSGFVLLELPDHRRIAYEEGNMMGKLSSDPEMVSFIVHCNALVGRLALSPERSERFIQELMEEL